MLNRLQDVFKSFQQNDVKYVVIGSMRASGRKVDIEDVRLLELPDQNDTNA